jgi:ABC-type phosphate/phosphonate transport system substrate-binding protein
MQKTRRNSLSGVVLSSIGGVLLFLAATQLAVAEIIMTAPPREEPEAGEKIYAPLAAHLSEILGEKVTYKQPKNWLEYQRDLRHDVYDIVFDGPHFVSWRVAHLNHDVLVKLPGTLEFVIVVHRDDEDIKSMKDLVGKKVCGIPPPNLATLTVIEQFQNPVRQPIIWGVQGGFKSVHETFKKGECRAAVFRTNYYDKKLTNNDRAIMRVLYKSKALPNQAISVSPRIGSKYKEEIIRSLTLDEKGKKAAEGIVKRFGEQQGTPFIAARKDEYSEHTNLLEGVVFGW